MRLNKNEIAACIVIAVGVSFVLAGSFAGAGIYSTQSTVTVSSQSQAVSDIVTTTPQPIPTPTPKPTVTTVHFSATGDNLIHDGIYLQAKQRGGDGNQYDFTAAYENMRDFYAQFDTNWLNQETLVNNAFDPSGYPMFSTPAEITNALYDIGFRVFSLSNNHSYDKGSKGIESSLSVWSSMPDDCIFMGFYDLTSFDNYAYQTVNGISFGYLSYTEQTNGLPTPNDAVHGVVYLDDVNTIERQIAAMRPNCDVLVVSCHWGVEGSHNVNDYQKQKAQWLADLGVDLIIGTHPHVTQTAEWLTGVDGNSAFVAYSLGNFINAQADRDNMIGGILDITFEKTVLADGSNTLVLKDPKIHGVVTQYESGYKDIRVYPFSSYTDALGSSHGNFVLTRDTVKEVLQDSIDPQFLELDE